MQKCPCCRSRLKDALCCPRCKADLQAVIQVRRLAGVWYKKALDYYLMNDWQACLDALNQSLQLRHSESAFLFRSFVLERRKRILSVRLRGFVQDMFSRSKAVVKKLLNNLLDRFAASADACLGKVQFIRPKT